MIASMIFFPSKEMLYRPADFGLAEEDIFFQTEDGVRLHGWYFKAEGDLCLLFFHGNAGNISSRVPKASEWVKRGVSVFLLDYRGYGKSEGSIQKGEDLNRDGRAALGWLRKEKGLDPSQVVLYGESIGSAPAVELATENVFRALILETPFTSIKELAKVHYGFVPDFFLKDFDLNNESKIGRLRCPVFILHGREDEVAPFSMGERLFEKAPEPKASLWIPGGHHNDLSEMAGAGFFETPHRFVLDHPKQ